MQWNVLVIGIKNARAQFHRMMEWVLRDIPNAHPYIDEIIFGSDGETVEEPIENHIKDIRRVLKTIQYNQFVASPAKSALFQKEVEFLVHVIPGEVRKPSPDKHLPLQKWEIPRTIIDLRLLLGLTNYFSEYVKDYSTFAAPLMAKLQVGREDGRKGSKKAVLWNQAETERFDEVRHELAQELTLFQPDFEQPYILRSDASDLPLVRCLHT